MLDTNVYIIFSIPGNDGIASSSRVEEVCDDDMSHLDEDEEYSSEEMEEDGDMRNHVEACLQGMCIQFLYCTIR